MHEGINMLVFTTVGGSCKGDFRERNGENSANSQVSCIDNSKHSGSQCIWLDAVAKFCGNILSLHI